jgi:hypothetical protein
MTAFASYPITNSRYTANRQIILKTTQKQVFGIKIMKVTSNSSNPDFSPAICYDNQIIPPFQGYPLLVDLEV